MPLEGQAKDVWMHAVQAGEVQGGSRRREQCLCASRHALGSPLPLPPRLLTAVPSERQADSSPAAPSCPFSELGVASSMAVLLCARNGARNGGSQLAARFPPLPLVMLLPSCPL